mmetsp:Transcript_5546/g.8573  ORF Transcript_5546/g.8573 Transcript_5546/m.8573 type:complete len:446 (+) Transcript_5546:95-1432(+)
MESPSLQGRPNDASRSVEEWHRSRDEMEDGVVDDISVKFLYKSYRILALICVFVYLSVELLQTPSSEDMIKNTFTAFRAAACFILTIGAFVFPRGPFVRPHPMVWRVLFGVLVLYELALVLLLFQSKKDARLAMTYIDSSLNIQLEEKEYATNCEVTWLNVASQIDIFVLAHSLGWVCKALVIRDRLILWHMSVTWEFVEMTLSYKLPNFAECWWDHWVMDVILCNGIGIEIGIWICKYLEVKEYKWHSVYEYPTFCGKVNRTILQFTPKSWIRVDWDIFRSTRRYLEIHFMMIIFQLIDLNSFFLKRLLWIPTKNYMNTFRVLLLCINGLVVIRQYYVLISHPTYNRVGLHSWLFYVVLYTEILLIAKLSQGEFSEPMPDEVKRWLRFGGGFYIAVSITGLIYSSIRHRKYFKNWRMNTSSLVIAHVDNKTNQQEEVKLKKKNE